MDAEATARKQKHVAEEYLSSLSDLQCNSKPLINMLTMLAEENIDYAPIIVKVVEQHIAKVPTDLKLPILYLIDSIVKNVQSSYIALFGQCIVNIFCGVFEKVNEKVRERMYALRLTWNEVFPASKLYNLDVRVKQMDKNWPITAVNKHPTAIHVNPNFLKAVPNDMEELLQTKTRELLELKKRKLELELEATKKHIEEQQKQLSIVSDGSVVPLLDPHIDPNILASTSAKLPQIMPAPSSVPTKTHVNPALLASQAQITAGNTGSLYSSRSIIPPQKGPMQMVQQVHPGMAAQTNINKVKVHPVNPALLNSIRHRDPRLMRQQLQQQTPQTQQANITTNVPDNTFVEPSLATTSNTSLTLEEMKIVRRGGPKSSKSSRYNSGSETTTKSPTRHSSHRSSKSSRSSSSVRSKDRERKRSTESKSYTKSSDRRYQKTGSSSSSSSKSKIDKERNDIIAPSVTFKQPRSSSVSPTKFKDQNKRLQVGKTTMPSSSKNGILRRSNSPDNIVSSTKDIDLRADSTGNESTTTTTTTSTTTQSYTAVTTTETNKKAAIKGLEQTKTSTFPTTSISATAMTTTTSSSLSSTSIQLPSVSNAKYDSDDKISKKLTNKMDSSTHQMDVDEQHLEGSSRNAAVDGKKRMSETGVNDEPIAKKSKSTKMDALFGSEDVDLRTLPPPIMAKSNTNEVLIPPPPPNISSSDDDQQQEVIRNREIKTSRTSTQNTVSQKLPSNFEDVRAKFAKATRLSKLEKSNEKARQKLSELNTNDDETTQEAEDEKIRIILSQAQEMLESNSLNQGQYKQLVQTVMSLNEKNKLKEAKRRESLQQQNVSKTSKDATVSPKYDDDDNTSSVSAELMAARDAVLRKRIPKISKSSSNLSSDVKRDEDSRDVGSAIAGLNKLKPKEKRVRNTKWADRGSDNQGNSNPTLTSQRGWMAGANGPSGKRPNVGIRGGNIPPPPQAPQPPLILGPNSIHPIHGCAGGWSHPQSGNPPNRPILFPNQMPLIRSSVPPPPQPPPMSIPPVLPALTPNGLPKPCNSIDNPQAELVRTITIDGQSKDIRIYDDVAIVFMEIDEPREIGFQPGQRAIIIDNQEPVTLRFNDEYRPLMIAGEHHRVRFGFPSRELYIDEHWYEIYFGGPPVSIPINNRIHVLKAEGPPPQVNIGPLRHDLVVGKIHMIVEAVNLFPLFLDARVQMFRLDGREHTVQFADNLLTVLLNDQPNQVEYGGLPKSYNLSGKRYFIRFTTLPKGVIAGKVEIKDMIYVKTEPSKKIELPVPLPISGLSNEDNNNTVERMDVQKDDVKTDEKMIVPIAPDDIKTTDDVAPTLVPPVAATTALGKINIDELFQKLVSSGILNNNITTADTNTKVTVQDAKITNTEASLDAKTDETIPEKEEEKLPPIIPIDLRKSESIKTRQEAIISTLYSGMQCSSCGVRFPPEQTIKYSQHLDWHFRQNRRERDSTRKAHSRKWYYELNDWLQYEEIEDLEEREKNFFEAQQNEIDAIDDVSNQRSTNSPMPSCPAGPDDVDRVCDMCQEKFEQFYNEELEEWHLRAALRVEDKIYHPLCYEDYKASLNPPTLPETDDTATKSNDQDVIMQEDDNAVDVVIKIEDEKDEKDSEEDRSSSDVIIADDDDDVIVLPNEEPSVTEIVDDDDDEEYVPANVSREEMSSLKNSSENENKDESAMESDVEIQEPNIPFTDLDTYEEKELPTIDESSQASFLNVKIKEEPKDDEDEDDGFEDVGTVIYGPHDEISIQSSEETQTIVSSTDSPLTVGGEHSSSANIFNPTQTDEPHEIKSNAEVEDSIAAISDESNHISIDGNLEPTDGHNLSSAGPNPAIPLGSLVNKIKINITKNTSAATTSSTTIPTTAAVSSATTSTATTESSATNSLNSNSSNNSTKSCNLNTSTNVVSTIPVLCAGGTMPSSNNIVNNSNISNITVIGSYSSYHKPQHHHHHQQKSVSILPTPVNTVVGTSTNNTTTTSESTTTSTITRQRTPSPSVPAPAPAPVPVPVEEIITYELKPALKNANLKKMKKVQCGIETSGLCSIM